MNSPSARLGIYLNDHLAGATAGTEMARRVARGHRQGSRAVDLRRLADEIAADRQSLLGFMDALGVPVRRYKVYGGWLGEKAGRLKPNGRVLRRSGLSTVLELEALRLGVQGKSLLWRALLALAPADRRLDRPALERLDDRAEGQMLLIEELRLTAASALLAPQGEPERTAG